MFAFLKTGLLLSAASGSFQKVLQPPGGLWSPGCGQWVTPDSNGRGCSPGAVGAVPCQVGDGAAQEGWDSPAGLLWLGAPFQTQILLGTTRYETFFSLFFFCF